MKVIKPLTFSNFEFERASPATYYNSSGVLSVAAVDVLRESYNPNTLAYEGPIFENAATNLVPYSNDFSQWTPFNSATGVGVGAPPVNPDASLPVQFMESLGTSAWQVYQSVGALSGLYTFSIFTKVKTPQAGTLSEVTISVLGGSFLGFTRFNIDAAAPTVVAANNVISNTIQKINNGWLRLSITVDLPFDGVSRRLNIYGGAPAGGSDGKGFHYLWGAQLEEGAVPTSFIYTNGAPATRAADIQISNPPSVISSNVDEDEAPTWAAGTAYLAGDQVQVLGAYHRLYTAVVNNTGLFPPTNTPATWIDNGNTNPWRMFDMATGAESQTVSTAGGNSIQVVLAVKGGVDSVVLLNMEGGFASIVVRDSGGGLLAEYEQSLLGGPSDTGWWDFFFGDRKSNDTVVFTDFNLVTPGTITVTVEGGSSPAKIGKLIVGESYVLGCAKFGTSAGIIDFSRKERDPFGNNIIVERRYIDKCEYDILIDTDSAYDIKKFLASIRATPAVYIGSENHLVTVVFGFYRDFSIVLQGPKKTACSLQAEGI